MTQKEIAEALDLSVPTVSLSLKDSPIIKKETRERVKNLARLTNYRPNLNARGLLSGRTMTIGIIFPSFQPFHAELAEKLHFCLKKHGYVGIFFPAGNIEEYREAIEILLSRKVDGIISGAPHEEEEVLKLKEESTPVVFHEMQHVSVDCVNVDKYRGGYLATSHLINLGHKKIGFIGMPTERVEDRFAGYRDALKQHNLPLEKKWVIPGWGLREIGYEGMKTILALKDRPTAVFALTDMAAIGAMRSIFEAGLKVPEDFAVVGFDNLEESRYPDVALTTIDQPRKEAAEKLTELLLDRIKNGNKGASRQIIIEPKLVIRESCGYFLNKGKPLEAG